MGYEAKAKEEMIKLGMYNVHILVEYLNGERIEMDVKSWKHVSNFIACDLYDGSIRVFVLNQVKFFDVSAMEKVTLNG